MIYGILNYASVMLSNTDYGILTKELIKWTSELSDFGLSSHDVGYFGY